MSSLVLVVDDDPVSVHLLEIILQRSGYEVVSARSANEGFRRIAAARPELVIIDDMMPEITGGEMCRHIKDDPDLQTIPVILISAGLRVQDAGYIHKVGADYALVKPILPREVIKAVETLLG
jgi:CheY-like chemotaxis protein